MYDPELGMDKIHAAILRILAGLRYAFEWIPYSKLKERITYPESEIKKRLRELNKAKAIQMSYNPVLKEWTFKITQKGLDLIALWDLKRNDVIKQLGTMIGEGKEALIYSALTPDDEWVIIKFHRYYGHEFTKIKKSLAYIAIKWRIKELKIEEYKIDIPRAKAQIEHYVLQRLSDRYPVPEPISWNRHVVVMKMIYDYPGIPAKDLRQVKLENPKEWLNDILETYNQIVEKEGIVHGDLAPDNILVKQDGTFYVIDWPQAVPKDFEGAEELYKRDVQNIKEFFKKKYGVN